MKNNMKNERPFFFPAAMPALMLICSLASCQWLAAENGDGAILFAEEVIVIRAEPGEQTRKLHEKPLVEYGEILEEGFRLSMKATLGIDNPDPIRGKHSFDLMISPRTIAENDQTGRVNDFHVLYFNLKGNGVWELFHAGKKVAGEGPGKNDAFYRDFSNEIRLEIEPLSPEHDQAKVRVFINDSPRGEATIGWRDLDPELSLAFQSLNATTRLESVVLRPLP